MFPCFHVPETFHVSGPCLSWKSSWEQEATSGIPAWQIFSQQFMSLLILFIPFSQRHLSLQTKEKKECDVTRADFPSSPSCPRETEAYYEGRSWNARTCGSAAREVWKWKDQKTYIVHLEGRKKCALVYLQWNMGTEEELHLFSLRGREKKIDRAEIYVPCSSTETPFPHCYSHWKEDWIEKKGLFDEQMNKKLSVCFQEKKTLYNFVPVIIFATSENTKKTFDNSHSPPPPSTSSERHCYANERHFFL